MLRLMVLPPAQWSTFAAGHTWLPGPIAAKLYRLGLAAGWPDLLCVHDGHVFGIELKRKGGRLSKDRTVRTRHGRLRLVEGQQTIHPRLEAAGMKIAVCHSVDEVLDALRAWGVPLRRIT